MGSAENLGRVTAVAVLASDAPDFLQESRRKGDRLQPQIPQTLVCHPQFILGLLVAGIIHKCHRNIGQGMDQSRQIPNTVGLGGLIEDPDPLTRRRRMIDGQFDAADGIADVDEGPGLPAGTMNRQWMAHRRLHEETVEHRAEVAVIVEAVDEPLVQLRLRRLRPPDDTLVQVSDSQSVVFVVVVKKS